MTQTEKTLSSEEQIALDRVGNAIRIINQIGKYRLIQFVYLTPFIIGGGVFLGLGIIYSGENQTRQLLMAIFCACVIIGNSVYFSYHQSWSLLAKSIDERFKPRGHDCQIWDCFSLIKELTFKNIADANTLRAILVVALSSKRPKTIRNRHHNTLIDLIIDEVNSRLNDLV